MGCVSSKGFRSGPDKVSLYSPAPNVSASTHQRFSVQKDVDNDNVVCLTSGSNRELDVETCQGSFLNLRRKVKHYKMLPSDTELEDSFTFSSNLAGSCAMADRNTKSIMEGDIRKHTFMCNNADKKPIRLQKHTEPNEETKHFAMRDFLDLQHMETHKGTKGSLWEEQSEDLLVLDSIDVKKGRNSAGAEQVCKDNGGAKFANFEDERESLLTGSDFGQHDIEIINMQELMEGLDNITRTPSSLSSRICSTLSIPERDTPFDPFSGLTSAPGSDLGSPVWKKYYMPDNGITYTHTPAAGSPFNESPRRAPSQSSFIDVDDARSVSSIEVPDANAIGLKILLSPANSSFHPSPVNWAPSHISNCNGNSYVMKRVSDENNMLFCGPSYDPSSSYRSRKLSMESIFGSIEDGHVGNDVKALHSSPNMTTTSSRRPSMESGYGSGSPLFDPSLMATFEEALKASTGMNAYDDWLRFSTDESRTLSSVPATTWTSLDTSMVAENTSLEKTTEKPWIFQLNRLEVKSKAVLGGYEFKCPPRGEGKVVLYFTSLRGIRKTFEDCCNVRLILRGLGIQVDERDVWMHSEFKGELNDILGGLSKGMPQVPQLFIKGRHIGGAEVVKQLHEEGALAGLMDGFAMGLIHSVCDGCGDARFVPCFTCSGSRKVLNVVDEVTQCLTCNENGLIMCPVCIT